MELKGENGLLVVTTPLVETVSQAAGDRLLLVTVGAWGYSAKDEIWVHHSAWASFLDELRRLERGRKGSATLCGLVADEFKLCFYSTDSWGHMAVEGHMRRSVLGRHIQALKFGFDFEPDLLPAVLRQMLAQ